MKTAQEAYIEIEKHANEKANQEVRHIEKMEVGQVFRQGDIYLHRVAADHLRGEKTQNRQLAPGSTQGSRHCVGDNVSVFMGVKPPATAIRALIGPVIVSDERFTLRHPEHAHGSFPAGTYQVTYQLDPRTMQRSLD